MNRSDTEARYKDMGLESRFIVDKPGEIYEPHKHAGVYLFTLDGSAKVRLDDGDWQEVGPGQETHIQDDQLHEAVAGPEGWSYVFATSPDEMKRQGL